MATLLLPLVIKIGKLIAELHNIGIVHGDLSCFEFCTTFFKTFQFYPIKFFLPTSNIMVTNVPKLEKSSFQTTNSVHKLLNSLNLILIDFGLSQNSSRSEEKAVDLYVLEKAWISTHPTTSNCLAKLWESYFSKTQNSLEIENRLSKVRLRGRKRSMLG